MKLYCQLSMGVFGECGDMSFAAPFNNSRNSGWSQCLWQLCAFVSISQILPTKWITFSCSMQINSSLKKYVLWNEKKHTSSGMSKFQCRFAEIAHTFPRRKHFVEIVGMTFHKMMCNSKLHVIFGRLHRQSRFDCASSWVLRLCVCSCAFRLSVYRLEQMEDKKKKLSLKTYKIHDIWNNRCVDATIRSITSEIDCSLS